jgi:hypothetical protein
MAITDRDTPSKVSAPATESTFKMNALMVSASNQISILFITQKKFVDQEF